MKLIKKKKKYLKKQIKKYTKYIKKDITYKYCKGDKFYSITLDFKPVIYLNIDIVNDIVEKILEKNNINYKKIFTKFGPSLIYEIKYIFIEKEEDMRISEMCVDEYLKGDNRNE